LSTVRLHIGVSGGGSSPAVTLACASSRIRLATHSPDPCLRVSSICGLTSTCRDTWMRARSSIASARFNREDESRAHAAPGAQQIADDFVLSVDRDAAAAGQLPEGHAVARASKRRKSPSCRIPCWPSRSPSQTSGQRSTVVCSRTPARTRSMTYRSDRVSTVTDSMPCWCSRCPRSSPAGPAPTMPTGMRCSDTRDQNREALPPVDAGHTMRTDRRAQNLTRAANCTWRGLNTSRGVPNPS